MQPYHQLGGCQAIFVVDLELLGHGVELRAVKRLHLDCSIRRVR